MHPLLVGSASTDVKKQDGKWKISYRNGFFKVVAPDGSKAAGLGFEPISATAPFTEMTIVSIGGDTTITGLSVAASAHQAKDWTEAAVGMNAEQAVEIELKASGEEHPRFGNSLERLAEYYRVNGDNRGQSIKLYQEAASIYKNALGEAYSLKSKTLDDLIANRIRLAGLYQSSLKHDKAHKLLEEASGLCQKQPSEHDIGWYKDEPNRRALDFACYSHATAGSYYLLHKYDQAINEYLKCKSTLEECMDTDYQYVDSYSFSRSDTFYHQLYDTCLENLAVLYSSMNNFKVAESIGRQRVAATLGYLEKQSLTQTEQQQLNDQASFKYRLDWYHSFVIKKKQLHQTAFELAMNWKGAVRVRQKKIRELAEESATKELFEKLRSKAQDMEVHIEGLRDVKTKPQLSTWEQERKRLSTEKDQLEIDLGRQSLKFQQLKKDVKLTQVLAALPKKVVLIDFHEFVEQTKNENGEDKWTEKLLAFVVRHDHAVQMIDLGERQSIYAAIDTWRIPMSKKRDTVEAREKANEAGALLRERLWLPAAKHFGECKTVLVSPVGELGKLPFSALPGEKEGSYLIDDYSIGVIPVPMMLVRSATEQKNAPERMGEILLFGGIDYGERDASAKSNSQVSNPLKSKQRFDTLNASYGELRQISKVAKKFGLDGDLIEQLDDLDAKEAAFCELAPKYKRLHLATHGFFAGAKYRSYESVRSQAPQLASRMSRTEQLKLSVELRNAHHPGLLSGLAFANANVGATEEGGDDGILTAEEIAFLPLKGVDMVTLSACETGLGKVAGGEGLLGLQRSFQIAGAQTVVATLWAVDDGASATLMVKFYKNLYEKDPAKKLNKLEALVQAQRHVLNNYSGDRTSFDLADEEESKRADPRHWAAWTLSGSWN